MHWLDWTIVAAYLVYIVYDGLRLTKKANEVEGYFLANRSLPWWAVGLSVMATQLSAITLVGTTGQAYADGMRFVQFYFGLPFAMVILCLTVVPFFYRARVYTAYEYLERRFDTKTRALASFCFLVQRALSCGVIIAAPSVILSIVLGWNELTTILVMGLTTTIYTMFGGVQAVTWTDVKQMAVIFVGLAVVLFVIISKFPAGVSLGEAVQLAGATGRLKIVDPSFNVKETYTLWSGLIGGLFLALSYFGCDQSQVQRFLTARSVSEGRTSLLMSAFIKIPMQLLILFIGVMVFVFYQFNQPPLIFKADDRAKVEQSGEYKKLEQEYAQAFDKRQRAAKKFSALSGGENLENQLLMGEAYKDLSPVVALTITDFVMFPETAAYESFFVLKDRKDNRGYPLDDLQLVFAELPKFDKSLEELDGVKEKWLYFLRHARELRREHVRIVQANCQFWFVLPSLPRFAPLQPGSL